MVIVDGKSFHFLGNHSHLLILAVKTAFPPLISKIRQSSTNCIFFLLVPTHKFLIYLGNRKNSGVYFWDQSKILLKLWSVQNKCSKEREAKWKWQGFGVFLSFFSTKLVSLLPSRFLYKSKITTLWKKMKILIYVPNRSLHDFAFGLKTSNLKNHVQLRKNTES